MDIVRTIVLVVGVLVLIMGLLNLSLWYILVGVLLIAASRMV